MKPTMLISSQSSMKTPLVLKTPLLLLALALPALLAGCSHPQPIAYYPPPPPPAWGEVLQHGYHDGVEAARNDIYRGKAPDAARHPRFRNPSVPPPAVEEYRHGFRDGYDQVYRHGAPPA